MDASRVRRVREEMERAEARRLQPHYIESFFHEAFRRLGGTSRQREAGRYQITHVPAPVRTRDRRIGLREPVLQRYERIAFEKPKVAPPGQPLAALVCPGHPLLDAVIDLTLERHRDLLKRGAVLVDPRDAGTRPRGALLPGARPAGCEPDAGRRPPGRLETDALRRARRGRRGPPSPLRAVPRLPASGRGRPRRRGDPRPARVRLDRPAPGGAGAGARRGAGGPGAPGGGAGRQGQSRFAKPRRRSRTGSRRRSPTGTTGRNSSSWTRRRARRAPGSTRAKRASGPIHCRPAWEQRLADLKLEAQISPLPPVVARRRARGPGGTRRRDGRADGRDQHDDCRPSGTRRPRKGGGDGDRARPSASSRRIASSRSWATTSRAASRTAAGCGSSRSRGAMQGPRRSP